jgi:hypothetical protein
VSNSTPSTTSQAAATPQPQIKKDVNPYENFNTQQYSQGNTQHVGMTLVPETQIDFSQLNWGMGNMGLQQNAFQPQVFAVTSIPEEPVDVHALSGKYANEEEIVEEETFEEAKRDVPAEIETAAAKENLPAAIEELADFDAEDPAFTLFASSPSPAPAAESTLEDAVNLLSQLPTEKSSQFDLVSEADSNTEMSAVFDKSCARLDAACRRLDALFSSFGL